jgi:NCS1 family nucleobase:cation symporter-1
MLSAPSQFGPGMPLEGKFWQVAVPAVTANVGYWATLSLNIPDFSRYLCVCQVLECKSWLQLGLQL